jgi:outer membrane protein assembly factor BamA
MIKVNIIKSGLTIPSCRIMTAIIFLWGQQVLAQKAVIGIIDFYGMDKVSASDIQHALTIKVHDTLDLDKFDKKNLLAPLLAVPPQ